MALQIPEPFQLPLKKLAEASESEQSALLRGLGALPEFSERGQIAEQVRNALSDFDAREIPRVVDTLISLASQRRNREPDEIGTLIAGSPSLAIPDERTDDFAQLITALVKTPALTSFARGLYVAFEHQNLYDTARILTEIRPIFGDDVEVEPIGSTLVNILALSYDSAGQSVKLHVALDEEDLGELRDACDRAISKARATKGWLDKHDLKYFNYLEGQL
jgi:hypothetical protein